ncbi:MAG: TonB-dependent receptor [Bacteroidota bacterium]
MKQTNTRNGQYLMALQKYLLILLFILGTFGSIYGQNIVARGTVTDEGGDPLVGASVLKVGTTRGVLTNGKGEFSIEVNEQDSLKADFFGFQSVTVSAAQSPITIVLPLASLDEVVVIGYGTTKKSDLTGSVSSVKSKELAQTTITSLEQGIQGRVAGVSVTQGDAAPGAGISIEIRGTNSILGGNQPLYVIDGIPITNPQAGRGALGASEPNNQIISNTNILATLSPSDIESIEILKDASATAIYGSRGANGVVIITTKRGSQGKGTVSFNASYGVSNVINPYEMLNTEEFMTYQNLAYENAGLGVISWPWAPDTVQNPVKPTISEVLALGNQAEVNWQEEVFQPAPVQDYQLGFSGGSKKGSYSVLVNYLDQEGVIKGSAFVRGGLRTNLSYEVNDRIRVTSSLSVTRSQNSLVRTSTNTTQTAGGIIRSVLNYSPIRALRRDEDTKELLVVGTGGDDPRLEDPSFFQLFGANPLRYTDEVTEEHNFSRAIAGVNTSIKLFAGLSADIRVAANYVDRKNNSYYPRTVSEGFGLNGLAVVSGNEFFNFVNENLLRYEGSFRKHRIQALVGFTQEHNRDYWINNEARDFPDDVLGFYALQNGLSHVPTRTNTATWTLASYLGRVNYVLSDKYMLTATFRYDGSSKFASNNKWAPFYSFAGAWRVSEEDFLKNSKVISNLKIRASYGQSGNQAISPYQSLATIQGVTTSFNNQLVPAVVLGRLQNDNLRWETTTQSNLGLDLDLWSGRLSAVFNIYQKETKDLLQQITLAPNTGFTSALVNAGNIQNQGLELELSGFPIVGKFSWQIAGNISFNRNEITDLGSVDEQFANRLGAGNGLTVFPFIQRPGLPIGAIYGYVEEGIFQTEEEAAEYSAIQPNAAVGQIRYQDTNNDGTINDQDRTIIGDTNPDYIWGLSNTFTWKGFDLSFLLQSVVGADIINTLLIRFDNLDGRRNIPRSVYESAWRGEGTSNTHRQINLNNGNSLFSDRFIEDGSYLRLKNLQLGYNVNASKIGWLSNARIYVNAVNLWTRTNYSGFDPEVSAFNSASMRGVDLGSYPMARTFRAGVNLTF